MATEDQEETARYYQGLANDAKLNAESIARTEAVGLAEQKKLQDTLDRLQRQRQTAITNAQREQIDNSIRVQTNNLDKNKSAVAQLQTERTAALQRVTANENLAKEAVGGPPAAKNIPGPALTPAPPPPPPSTIPVTPAATPAAAPPAAPSASPPTTAATPPPFGSANEGNAGEAEARIAPRPPAPPEDFVFDRDGNLLPSDSAAAAERREEILVEENRARWSNATPQPDFVTDPNTGELVSSDSAQAEEIRAEQNRVEEFNAAPQREFAYDPNTGEMIPSDGFQAQEIRATQTQPQPVPISAIEEGGEAEAQLALESRNAQGVPVNTTQVWDPETGTYGVWDEDSGTMLATGLTEEEAAEAAGDQAEVLRLQQEKEFEEDTPDVYEAEPPAPDFVYDPVTGEMIPGDSDRAAEIIAEERAEQIESERAEGQLEFVYDPVTGEMIPGDSDRAAEIRAEEAAAEDGAVVDGPAPVEDVKYDEFGNVVPNTPEDITAAEAKAAEQRAAEEAAAAKLAAINQATLQSVYKQVGSSDWRLRLQLAPGSNYLYNAGTSGKLDGSEAGILAPLTATNGVIFPYTPQINTNYRANYEQYDLVHSNYRGLYYKNSRVDDLNIRGVFTAQDTREADYLLAVIHFFRSVTKMFYGQDAQRGAPPPLVFLSGFGMNQFYGHPCVVTSFNYNLPDNVDYIRATNYNNYGTDLLSRRTPSGSSGVAGLGATGNRLLNAGLEKFFPANKPTADSVTATVNNSQLANYVPTRMEIDITLIPVQTRSQVSKQFSLKGFANGELIKGGFW
jgi:hypothetical protein